MRGKSLSRGCRCVGNSLRKKEGVDGEKWGQAESRSVGIGTEMTYTETGWLAVQAQDVRVDFQEDHDSKFVGNRIWKIGLHDQYHRLSNTG